MKNKNKNNRENHSRKFLIITELLIAVISAGILVYVMMISSNESMNSTKALNIASNLRTLKTIAFAQYVNSDDNGKDNTIRLDKNISSEKITSGESLSAGCYGIYDGEEDSCFVGYKFADNEDKIKANLKTKAKTLGLKFSDNNPESGSGDSIVWLRVM
ncbi:MAG: hypothetical protein IJT21_05690 [Synergistaceae bacterium]|nr:hypothetical protein [Synergistaceae bacterium]